MKPFFSDAEAKDRLINWFITNNTGLVFLQCFFFIIRYNPEVPELLYVSDARRLTRSHYNRSNPLIVYLHGFSERAPGPPGASSYEIRNGIASYVFVTLCGA